MRLSTSEKLTFRREISDYAKSLGFDMIGFSPAKIEEKYLNAFDEWLSAGNHGTMKYMEKIEQRRDLSKILPGAASVIVLLTNYYRQPSGDALLATSVPALVSSSSAFAKASHSAVTGKVARYAYGRDYHKVIKKKLKELEKFIMEKFTHGGGSENISRPSQVTGESLVQPTEQRSRQSQDRSLEQLPEHLTGFCHDNVLTKSYVDTGEVLERALAEQAGLGRIGKNGCLITKEFGSWVFISEIITTVDLTEEKYPPSGRNKADPVFVNSASALTSTATKTSSDRWSDPAQRPGNVCGSCRKCIDACPTGAIIAPGIIDSRLCISYLTIENKDKIPPRLAKIIAKTKRLYGCDICQEVCPHNDARQRINTHQEFQTPIAGDEIDLNKIGKIKTDEQFLKIFAGSPLMRAKRKGLQRNAKILSPRR